MPTTLFSHLSRVLSFKLYTTCSLLSVEVEKKTKNRNFHFNFHVHFGFSLENGVKLKVITWKICHFNRIEYRGESESKNLLENRRLMELTPGRSIFTASTIEHKRN